MDSGHSFSKAMTDWDSNAIQAIGSPWERENESSACRYCGAKSDWDCGCGDELRDRLEDERLLDGQ